VSSPAYGVTTTVGCAYMRTGNLTNYFNVQVGGSIPYVELVCGSYNCRMLGNTGEFVSNGHVGVTGTYDVGEKTLVISGGIIYNVF